MKAKIKTFKKNERVTYMLVIFENMAFLRIKEYFPKSIVDTEIGGELIGNDLKIILPSGFVMVLENAKIRHLEQIEYDKFIEIYPEYRIKIENYINWFKATKQINLKLSEI